MKHPGPDRYHHGDARNALLAAAASMIEETGAQGLSLRQVAERAGLSRQAPYNHFADKEALLAELALAGFRDLESRIRRTRGYPADPAALEHAAAAYIGFAQRRPALFRLMFSSELVELARFPEAQAAGAACLASLEAIVAAWVDPDRVEAVSLAAWSLVHGYATLCIETRREGASLRGRRARLFARIIRAGAGAA
ncbi:TetR/AcrR family transcriptional regulator [Castellaniella denitrificans]|jgi:AcrR family transcriptional regulator|uniref:TetR/AcrR family transcriptional regulator n=1 Tax=Castellaniella denitrificans TaxID=56119 RepID=UPI00360D228F